jgi:nucleotide-binding universal stress UspA family protein
MAKFKKILVPLDGSANSMRGLDRAIEIAKGGDAEITGFYVFHLPIAAGIKYTAKMKEDAQKKAVKAIKKPVPFSNTKLAVAILVLKLSNLLKMGNLTWL